MWKLLAYLGFCYLCYQLIEWQDEALKCPDCKAEDHGYAVHCWHYPYNGKCRCRTGCVCS